MTWEGAPSWQNAPGRVVLSGETVHHVAGFSGQTPTTATLHWADDVATAHQESVTIEQTVAEGNTLARVAAAMRMRDSTPAERHALALQYGLISPTTNLILVHERADSDKPDQLPSLHHVPHAVPAAWGGLGSTRHGTWHSTAGAMLRASTHAAGSTGPAVWRRDPTPGTHRVAERQCETYDIPAFLRKQAPLSDYLYRDELRRFVDALVAPDADALVTPTSLRELAKQIPQQLIDQLQALIDAGFAEAEVVRVCVKALIEQFEEGGVAMRLRKLIQRLFVKGKGPHEALERQILAIVSTAVEARWPVPLEELPAWLRRAAD